MTKDDVPAFAHESSAVRALLSAWSARPADETAMFADSLLAKTVRSRPSVSSVDVNRLREIAAVSGAVRPADLAGLTDPGERESELLAAIGPEFDHALAQGRTVWTIRAKQRNATLARLLEDDEGLTRALQLAQSVETDAPGRILRRLLTHRQQRSGDAPTPIGEDSFGSETSKDLAQALLWASTIGDYAKDLPRISARVHVEQIIDSYRDLLRFGLIGRDNELRELSEFVGSKSSRNPANPIQVLTVSGVGGAGKSTLLAAALYPYLEALKTGSSARAVVVIDLDRAAFRPDAHAVAELTSEVTRQLELAWPELAPSFAAARAASNRRRVDRREFGYATSSGDEVDERQLSDIEWQVGASLRASERRTEPVVLVLDTFEEWQRAQPVADSRLSWAAPEVVMADWLSRLGRSNGFTDLRVIVSGRAKFATIPGVDLELGDLDSGSAEELLEELRVDPKIAPRLAEVVGGNPLTLRVAGQFARQMGQDERDAFLNSGVIDSTLDERLRRAVLYDRFIAHIHDEDVRQLAHPGLLLRRVTPELIRDVLAEICGLGTISATQARDLFERLADEVWLVRRADDGSLQHQPELRRAMVKLMSRDPRLLDRTRAVHEAAAQWYNPHPGVEDPITMDNVEAFYHRMMLSTGTPQIYIGEWDSRSKSTAEPRFGRTLATSRQGHERIRQQVVRYARQLGESVEEMHPAVEAQLRLARGDQLAAQQASLLPPDLWRQHVATQGQFLVDSDDPEGAVALFRSKRSQSGAPLPTWLAQAFCDSARWEAFATEARSRSSRGGAPREPSWSGPSSRYEFINLIVSDDDRARRELLQSVQDTNATVETDFIRTFFSALGLASTGHRTPDVAPPREADPKQTFALAFPVDQLRHLVVNQLTGADLPWPKGARIFPDVAGLLAPSSSVMHSFTQLTGDRGFGILAMQLMTLEKRANEAGAAHSLVRSNEILGDMAAQVAKDAFSSQPWPTPVTEDALLALRGDNPELRPAIRNVLRLSAPGEDWLKTLADIASSLLQLPVVDLRPDAMPLMSDVGARAALVTLVEYVDRSRMTGPFLHTVQVAHPGSRRLNALLRAFDRWDVAHWTLLHGLPNAG